MFGKLYPQVLKEINSVLSLVQEDQINELIADIINAKTIVVCGAGRVGMAIRGFGMRLGHLGFQAYTIGDSTVPHIGAGDLLLLASGSGETQTIYDIAEIGKKDGARIALVTGHPESRIGRLAHTCVSLKAPSKKSTNPENSSIQPMTTLNEQCLQLFFDCVVLLLMERTKQQAKDLWNRHSSLE